jgi:hypothetical protein
MLLKKEYLDKDSISAPFIGNLTFLQMQDPAFRSRAGSHRVRFD